MASLNQEDVNYPPLKLATALPRLRWTQLLSISIFALAFNFHWAALGTIILPAQVLKIVGDQQKGAALAFVLVPGAFVSLFANPLFGWLSDRTRGWFATWGRRRPYILVGTLVNVACLVWMASSYNLISLMLAYMLVQFSSNAAQSPFHALLPDIVPPEQRGLTSGIIGLLGLSGNIGGVILAGILINSSKPLPVFQQGVWLTYSIIMVVMLALMVVTLFSVRDRAPGGEEIQLVPVEQVEKSGEARISHPWLSRSLLLTLGATALAIVVAWGLMTLWNVGHAGDAQINSSVEQVILELLATVGILRLFDFNPRRDPDFAWVLATRLVMMLGIYTIQNYLDYYMKDVVKAADPEAATTFFLILVSLTSLASSFTAGWLSDHFGRKRLVYISGFLMALVGMVFVLTHSFTLVIVAGATFGLGYGAYQSVDWALVADVLPSRRNFARDMGVWNIALSLPQVIAPVVGGPIIDTFTRAGQPVQGFQVLFSLAIVYCVIGTITVRFIRSIK